MKTIFILLSAFIISNIANTQNINKTPVKVGQPIGPFTFSNVRNYSKASVTREDFKGKWLILDFWNSGCIVCARSMPKMDSLQKKLKHTTQILLVGYTGSQYHQMTKESDEQRIKDLYERLRKNIQFDLPSAFDSSLFHRLDITACPYIIIVNPEGIIKGVTSRINYYQMDSLQRGLKIHLKKAYTQSEIRDMYRKEATSKSKNL